MDYADFSGGDSRSDSGVYSYEAALSVLETKPKKSDIAYTYFPSSNSLKEKKLDGDPKWWAGAGYRGWQNYVFIFAKPTGYEQDGRI